MEDVTDVEMDKRGGDRINCKSIRLSLNKHTLPHSQTKENKRICSFTLRRTFHCELLTFMFFPAQSNQKIFVVWLCKFQSWSNPNLYNYVLSASVHHQYFGNSILWHANESAWNRDLKFERGCYFFVGGGCVAEQKKTDDKGMNF